MRRKVSRTAMMGTNRLGHRQRHAERTRGSCLGFERSCTPLKFTCWKLNPQCKCWEVVRALPSQVDCRSGISLFCSSAMWGHTSHPCLSFPFLPHEHAARKPSPHTRCQHSNLQNCGKQISTYYRSSLWHSVVAAQNTAWIGACA
jgi:hypothetical protein